MSSEKNIFYALARACYFRIMVWIYLRIVYRKASIANSNTTNASVANGLRRRELRFQGATQWVQIKKPTTTAIVIGWIQNIIY